MNLSRDRAPPPMPIRSDNFAGLTFERRLPRMIDEVLAQGGWSAEVIGRLERLRTSLPRGPIPIELLPMELDPEFLEGLPMKLDPELRAGGPREGEVSWDELPFFEAETIFHFALLGATGYEGETSRDPFRELKREGLESGVREALEFAEKLGETTSSSEELEVALEASAWGNVHDLSQFQRRGSGRDVLVDERERVLRLLERATMVDVVLDNAGSELTCDLLACEVLLRRGQRVRLHHKPRPFFVSDATERDVRETIAELRARSGSPLCVMGERLEDALGSGQLELETAAFWCRPLHLSAMPDALRDELRRADVVLLKGDLNYRRIIEDRLYPFDTPAALARPAGFPPLVALRVLKSEVLVGLAAGQGEALDAAKPGWMTSGESAVIQVF